MRFKNHPFRSEAEAAAFLDNMRWPNGLQCPRCLNKSTFFYDMSHVRGNISARYPNGKPKIGLKKCGMCRLEFRSTTGTPFENVKVPLDILLAAIVICKDCNFDIGSGRLSEMLGVKRHTAASLKQRAFENLLLRAEKLGVEPNMLVNSLGIEAYDI